MSKQASPAAVGGFVVTAFVLLLITILALGGGRLFRSKAQLIVYFDTSVNGLRIGGPVKFRGIEIGRVKQVHINMPGVALDPEHVRIPVVFEIDEEQLRQEGAPPVNLHDKRDVQRLVDQGLRAQLATESLVTGVRYIELDIKPGTPARLVHDRRYPEVPPIRGTTEAIPDRVEHVLRRLEEVDIAALASSLQAAVDDVDKLLGSKHLARAVDSLDDVTASFERAASELGKTARDLRPTVAEAKDTVASVRQSSEQMARRLDTTLQDISGAARSLRRLADQLARDPGAIMRGGKQ